MWKVKYKELEVFGEDPAALLENACKQLNMAEHIHNPFELLDLKGAQFKPEFGKIITFRIWLLDQPKALNIGVPSDRLPEVAETIAQKIQFRKYADLWDEFLKYIERY